MDTSTIRNRTNTTSTTTTPTTTPTGPTTTSGQTRPTGNGAASTVGNRDSRSAAPHSTTADTPPRTTTPGPRTNGTSHTKSGFNPDVYADERDDVLSVINELEDQLDRYEDLRTGLERDLAGARTDLTAAQQRVQEVEWQNNALQTRVDALEQVRNDLTLLEEELTDANVRTQRVTEQLTRGEVENTRLTQELKSATKQLDEFATTRKERDGLRNESKTLRSRLEQFERTQNEMISERAALHARIEEQRRTSEEQRSDVVQLDAELRSALERLAESTRTRESLDEKLDTLRTEKKSLQAQLTHLERENARVAEQQKITESEAATLRSINRGAESALTNVKKAFAEVRAALAETRLRARRRPIDTSTGRPMPTTRTSTPADALLDEVNEAMRYQTEWTTPAVPALAGEPND